ncbi:hypothetical protein QC764_200498 [Podospora pseudoanserina]|uniref:Uncharacterized protein n=1 Tax=Podospora pseudoanserina TaxID=2609844 RepID=A0ABR0IF33_9PEZI|nr:hypothetical protein QC764_200498 [Podospora pseudoanserina]
MPWLRSNDADRVGLTHSPTKPQSLAIRLDIITKVTQGLGSGVALRRMKQLHPSRNPALFGTFLFDCRVPGQQTDLIATRDAVAHSPGPIAASNRRIASHAYVITTRIMDRFGTDAVHYIPNSQPRIHTHTYTFGRSRVSWARLSLRLLDGMRGQEP